MADDATQTGTVIHHQFAFFGRIQRECLGPQWRDAWFIVTGCTVPQGTDSWPSPTHEYVVWYAEGRCAPVHELCHALYEIGNEAHTLAFNLRLMRMDALAACPE